MDHQGWRASIPDTLSLTGWSNTCRSPIELSTSPAPTMSVLELIPTCPFSAMGKSRSATVLCAYLMKRYRISPSEALSQIRQSRPLCEPNDGFMQQLQLYHQMEMTEDVEDSPVYQRWLYQREIEMSRACGQAPEAEKIRFEDEHVSDATATEFELRCRKCR